jgi:lysyl-tRNA synthetase class 2
VEELWKPSCDIKYLHLRAEMLRTVRNFFYNRTVLEVETPVLCQATGTDPQLDFFSSFYHTNPNKKQITDQQMYLQTSPEFAMKRLLAAGSGSIFQICKAFRNGESGQLHNPEFSILEWYRVGFTLEQLMDEVTELIDEVLIGYYCKEAIVKISYEELFFQHTELNPLVFCQNSYANYAAENAISEANDICGNDHSMWLDFIFSHKVQPVLANQSFAMVYGYPAIQSSLARINQENTAIVDRFEVFINGIEIGNGFFELSDAKEQEKRFDSENKSRELQGKQQVVKDKLFLASLESGLPDCSGIALGLDRLLMILANASALKDVIAFPFDSA